MYLASIYVHGSEWPGIRFTAESGATTKSKVDLNCFLTDSSYCCDISEGTVRSGIPHCLHSRIPCVR